MLRIYGVDTDGRVHSLPAVCRLRISQSRDVPADSLRILLYGLYEEEFCRVYIYDEEKLMFSAEVDEQTSMISENSFTELICRSTAAILLDNEAKPQNFVNPSCEVLFREYAAPYGFTEYYGADKYFQGEFSVAKGISCYEVLEKFSRGVFDKLPKVKGDEVYFEGEEEKPALYFSDEKDGLPFTDFAYNRLRCRLFSRILVKTRADSDYSTEVCDEDARNSGILRERYMDVSETSKGALIDAHNALNKSRAKSEEISLLYPGRLFDVVSASAVVSFRGKLYDGFEVRSLDYLLEKDSEYTRLNLCRKEI